MKKQKSPQGKKAKEEYDNKYSPLKELMADGEIHSKNEIKHYLQLPNERQARMALNKMSMFYPVTSFSSRKGYRLIDTPKIVERSDSSEMAEVIREINHCINDYECRIKELKKRMKPLIASKKVILVKIAREETK